MNYEIQLTNNKTRLCKNVETNGICKRQNCGFFHNENERKIQLCKFNLKCINERCELYHESENIKDYIERINPDIKYIYLKSKDDSNIMEYINNAIENGYKNIIIICNDDN